MCNSICKPTNERVVEKVEALKKYVAIGFAISIILGLAAAGCCYAIKGNDLAAIVRTGTYTCLATFILSFAIPACTLRLPPKVDKVTPQVTPQLEIGKEFNHDAFQDAIVKGIAYTWKGKKSYEVVPNVFVGENIPADKEVRLLVLRNGERASVISTDKILYYEMSTSMKPAVMKEQAHKMMNFIQQDEDEKVLLTGIYDKDGNKIKMPLFAKESPFVDVGLMLNHYLLLWCESSDVTKEEVSAYLKREFQCSYAEQTRVYTGTNLTLTASCYIDKFCPDSYKDFDEIDLSNISSICNSYSVLLKRKLAQTNLQPAIKEVNAKQIYLKIKSAVQECLDLEDDNQILKDALVLLPEFDLNTAEKNVESALKKLDSLEQE